jgi:hypothetical protein
MADKNGTNPFEAMGAFFSKQVERRKLVTSEKQALATRLSAAGETFPGSGHRPADRMRWMGELGPDRVRVHQVVWPGTHDSATNKIGIPFVTRPFAQCQSMSVYEQLCTGARVIDVRVQEERRVCHGVLATYPVDVVLDDVSGSWARPNPRWSSSRYAPSSGTRTRRSSTGSSSSSWATT